jgi:hypothetical protein
VQVNVLATILFMVTTIAIVLVIWQQRRAEHMAALRPDQEVAELVPLGMPPAPGALGG